MKYNLTYIGLVGIHIAIGFLIYLNRDIAKIYFLVAVAVFLFRIINIQKELKTYEVLKACAYFVGAEVLFRMTRGSLSYEAGKYIVIFFSLLGMVYKGISGKGYPYFIYLMLLVPSIFVASTTLSFDANFRTNIAFVLSGPVCLGIAALFCYDKKVTIKQLNNMLLFMVLPIIANTTYVFFYTPSIKETLSNTASNVAASGGFGPNQVSITLGLGMFIMVTLFFNQSNSLKLKIFNLGILALISYRAVLTFSRGGVITAILVILAFLFFYYRHSSIVKKNSIMVQFMVLIVCLMITWTISSNHTDGYIDLRYANKDHLGQSKEDLTTGRGDLFMYELKGFISNPFFGIGSSRAKDQRIELEGQGNISHSEVGRLLGEHGIFGIIILLILIFKPLYFRSNNKKNYYFYAFLGFWFATINHASMRIAAPSFIYALALLNVTHEKRPIHRKQIKE
ncbi:O-antigen ligase family protein [Psychroserpens mesophilus]|uniref:O-antigen ligase family protein n=1 Tax=Psychroserpens mesophilus TaxID=325473 RepID=UPI003D64BA85